MPIDPILAKPTLPVVEENRGPLLYNTTIGQNDVDVDEANDDSIDDDKDEDAD